MRKYPEKIVKQKISFKTIDGFNLNGECWLDRWNENVWFFGKFKEKYGLFVPVQFKRIIKQLKFADQMYLNFKLMYGNLIPYLIYDSNPLLKLVKGSKK